jgi:hypothetical protein
MSLVQEIYPVLKEAPSFCQKEVSKTRKGDIMKERFFNTTKEIVDWVEENTTEEHRGEGKSAEDAVIWFTAYHEAEYMACDSTKEMARNIINGSFPVIKEIDDCALYLFQTDHKVWEEQLRLFWLG